MKRHPTKRSKEAKEVMADFRAEHLAPGKRCWLCEREQATDPHHIEKRRGDQYDVPENLLAVCPTCHRRIHDGPQTLIGGNVLPMWTRDDVLRAKQRHDPDNYDPEVLFRLRFPERWMREFFNIGKESV